MSNRAPIKSVDAFAYTIPTQEPESDGTLEWHATTMIYVEIRAGGQTGIGYTYAHACTAALVRDLLAGVLTGKDALQTGARYAQMVAAIRNNGREGIASMALSALDVALWDLKGKLLGAPASALLGATRDGAPVYGSGGFTSYDQAQLAAHMARWVGELEIPRVKMKVGREPWRDPRRVAAVRESIGPDAQLFVDADGAYAPKQAAELARRFAQSGVVWLEEPVYHRDLQGNALVRSLVPVPMEIGNGEYGCSPATFAQILAAGAADVLQADVTRCGGFSGFIAADGLCQSQTRPLSSHGAPYATLHAALAAKSLRHIEFYYDHVLIEQRLFDGAAPPKRGVLFADPTRPGIGLQLRRPDAERYAA
ncbi:MAG TPA: enolase C-terminal domain-like protein [Verrucomicrobiae bacterium]|nr:enolase C-terminal domain-like protein [Verrucomicrobiae bacterium]